MEFRFARIVEDHPLSHDLRFSSKPLAEAAADSSSKISGAGRSAKALGCCKRG